MGVLITGGAGFIGSALVRKLVSGGVDAAVIDDLSTGRIENLDRVDVPKVIGSVLDPASLEQATDGVTAIVHLAALPSVPRSLADPFSTHAANATGTLAILEVARRTGAHVVLASSSSVYGNHSNGAPRAGPSSLASPYAASKLAGEAYAFAYANAFGLPLLVTRFFNVFGPRQRADSPYAAVLPRFIAAALAGDPMTIDGDGLQTRDFTPVEAVASTLARAVRDRVAHPDPVDLAFGCPITVLDLAASVERAVGRPLERVHRPPRPGDVRSSCADPDALRRLFGEPPTVDLDRCVAATLEWHREGIEARADR